MPIQVVMDSHGDSRYIFDAGDIRALADAEARFKNLTGSGFRAIVPGKQGQPGNLISAFDPSVDETLFVPPLEGG